MKKIYQLMTAIVIALFIVLLPSMVKAADEEKTITLEGIYITSPAGEYKTGDTLKFEARFSEAIAQDEYETFFIKIGEVEKKVYEIEKIDGNVIKYNYTVPDYSAGKITLSDVSDITSVKNSEGERVNVINNITSFDEDIDITVNTPEWTDISKMEYKIEHGDGIASRWYTMDFSNIEYKSNHTYYVFFTYNDEELMMQKDENGKIMNADGNIDTITPLNISSIIEKTGKIYMYIVEEQSDYSKEGNMKTSKVLVQKEEITRPAQNEITKRISNIYFSESDNKGGSVYVNEPFSENRILNIKIGRITDKTILNAIKNKEATGMTQLISYAKQQTDAKGYKIISNGERNNKLKNIDIDFTKGDYYYVYFSMNNENGKYVDVEDIMLYRVSTGSNEENGFFVSSMNDNKFQWSEDDSASPTPTVTPAPEEDGKDDSNTKKDDTTIKTDKLPQTGVGIGLTLSILLVALFGVVMFKKVRDYKEI